MKYLLDTNIFLHTINSNIYSVADKCMNNDTPIYITKTIIEELTPGYYMLQEDESSEEILNNVIGLTQKPFDIIKIIDINDNEEAKKIYNSIRDRFYGWMNNPEYLKLLIQQGKIKKSDIKNIRKKDKGECELIAIAKASNGEYVLITNDKGRVHLHPHINIFEEFKNDKNINIYSGEEWINKLDI